MANTIENFSGSASGTTFEFEVLAGTNSISSTISRTGTYSFRTNPTTTAVGSGRFAGLSTAGVYASLASASAFCAFWFRVDTLPAANDEEILRWTSGTTTLKCAVRITSTGTLKLYNISGTNTATSTAALTTGKWYRIDTRAANSTSGTFEVKLADYNGVLLETVTDAACDMGATNIGRIILGKHVNQNGNTVDYYYDDIWLDTGDYPIAGLWQVNLMSLVSDGTNQWTGGTGASDYTQINESPASVSEYIADPAAAAPVAYTGNLANFAASGIKNRAGILAAKAFFLAADVVATANTLQTGLRSNTTDSLNVANNTSTTTTEYGRILTGDPATVAAWTRTGLEAAQVKLVENTNTEDIRCYWAGMMVLNTPGPSPLAILGAG